MGCSHFGAPIFGFPTNSESVFEKKEKCWQFTFTFIAKWLSGKSPTNLQGELKRKRWVRKEMVVKQLCRTNNWFKGLIFREKFVEFRIPLVHFPLWIPTVQLIQSNHLLFRIIDISLLEWFFGDSFKYTLIKNIIDNLKRKENYF